jgi:hypothetical protein
LGKNPERTLAAHVRAAIGAVQAKMGAEMGQPAAGRVPGPVFRSASPALHLQHMVAAAHSGAKPGLPRPAGPRAAQAKIWPGAGSTAGNRSGIRPVVQRADDSQAQIELVENYCFACGLADGHRPGCRTQQVEGYLCKVCKVQGGHRPGCPAAPPEVVEEQGQQVGVHYRLSTKKGKGAVEVVCQGRTFTGSGNGCAEPDLLQTYAKEQNKKKAWKHGIALAWSQNTLPCQTCHNLLVTSSRTYSNTYVVSVEDNFGKPYGDAHGLPNNADTVITYDRGNVSYRA